MEATYAFTAYNTEAEYGFGSESQAAEYLAHLNKDREINLYEMEVSDLTDDEAENLAFNLADCLNNL